MELASSNQASQRARRAARELLEDRPLQARALDIAEASLKVNTLARRLHLNNPSDHYPLARHLSPLSRPLSHSDRLLHLSNLPHQLRHRQLQHTRNTCPLSLPPLNLTRQSSKTPPRSSMTRIRRHRRPSQSPWRA